MPVPQARASWCCSIPSGCPATMRRAATINMLADLRFEANGQRARNGQRDRSTCSRSTSTVPAGARAVDARVPVHHLAAAASQGRITMTPEMLNLQWSEMSLYPAGYYIRRIPVRPTVTSRAAGRSPPRSTAERPVAATGSTYADDQTTRRWSIRRSSPAALRADGPSATTSSSTWSPTGPASWPRSPSRSPRTSSWSTRRSSCSAPALRPLRLPARSDRPARRDRARASPRSENASSRGYFIDWDEHASRPQPAAARIRAQLERQVPPRRRPVDARLPHADAGQPAVGLRGPDPVLGLGPRRALRDAVEGGYARRDRATAATYGYRRRAATWRPLRTPPTIRSSPTAAASGLAQLAAQRGLLQRRPAGLARGRPDHPPGTGGGKRSIDDFARAFFGMRNGDYGELTYTFEDVVEDAQRRAAVRLGRISPQASPRRCGEASARGHHHGRLQSCLP